LYINNLLLPLRENIQNFYGVKKAKAYYKNLLNIEQDLTLFIEDLKKIRCSNKILIDSELLKIPDNKPKEIPKEPKKQKGDSAKTSLAMFKSGKTISEIAQERNVIEGTVFGHLSNYIVNGQISVYELVSREKVEQILLLIDAETKSTTLIKQQLGDDVSFDEIRAVMRHYNLGKKIQASPY
jgi:deoxyribodipyrimidine photolyase